MALHKSDFDDFMHHANLYFARQGLPRLKPITEPLTVQQFERALSAFVTFAVQMKNDAYDRGFAEGRIFHETPAFHLVVFALGFVVGAGGVVVFS